MKQQFKPRSVTTLTREIKSDYRSSIESAKAGRDRKLAAVAGVHADETLASNLASSLYRLFGQQNEIHAWSWLTWSGSCDYTIEAQVDDFKGLENADAGDVCSAVVALAKSEGFRNKFTEPKLEDCVSQYGANKTLTYTLPNGGKVKIRFELRDPSGESGAKCRREEITETVQVKKYKIVCS